MADSQKSSSPHRRPGLTTTSTVSAGRLHDAETEHRLEDRCPRWRCRSVLDTGQWTTIAPTHPRTAEMSIPDDQIVQHDDLSHPLLRRSRIVDVGMLRERHVSYASILRKERNRFISKRVQMVRPRPTHSAGLAPHIDRTSRASVSNSHTINSRKTAEQTTKSI